MPEPSATGSGALTGTLKDLRPVQLQRDAPVYFSRVQIGAFVLTRNRGGAADGVCHTHFEECLCLWIKCPEVLMTVAFPEEHRNLKTLQKVCVPFV